MYLGLFFLGKHPQQLVSSPSTSSSHCPARSVVLNWPRRGLDHTCRETEPAQSCILRGVPILFI
jgi:hypothetical protein